VNLDEVHSKNIDYIIRMELTFGKILSFSPTKFW
jgi:hypothetical protein